MNGKCYNFFVGIMCQVKMRQFGGVFHTKNDHGFVFKKAQLEKN